MKTYCFVDPSQEEPIEKTEEEILKEYYPYWKEKMLKVYKENDVESNYTEEDCIMDWVIVHWAWEKITSNFVWEKEDA